VVATHGRPVADPYLEQHWLPVLGPSATWLVRCLARHLDDRDETELDLAELAVSLGMVHVPGRDGPFARAFGRLVVFGFAQPSPVRPDHLFVRTIVPDVPRRLRERLAGRSTG
jgi:hypothetical protein